MHPPDDPTAPTLQARPAAVPASLCPRCLCGATSYGNGLDSEFNHTEARESSARSLIGDDSRRAIGHWRSAAEDFQRPAKPQIANLKPKMFIMLLYAYLRRCPTLWAMIERKMKIETQQPVSGTKRLSEPGTAGPRSAPRSRRSTLHGPLV